MLTHCLTVSSAWITAKDTALFRCAGANYESPEKMHEAFLANMTEDQKAMVPAAFYPMGILFCKWMWEKRPRHTRRELCLNELKRVAQTAACSSRLWWHVCRVYYQQQAGTGRG